MAKTSTAMEVGQECSLREGLEATIRERMREIIEMVLQEEVEAALGAGSQRVVERVGYRHGSKQRKLTLRTGTVQLAVPRARLAEADGSEREWQSQLVPRYRRSSREVEQSVLGVYLSGSNTRRIRGALEPLLTGAALSKSAVSRLVLRLEESYRTWQQRDLAQEQIVYLYLDAIYPKVRSGGKVVSLPVLVALGVRENGEKVLLSLMTTGAESADGWLLLLEDLSARKMGRPRLVISDGNTGLAAALDRLVARRVASTLHRAQVAQLAGKGAETHARSGARRVPPHRVQRDSGSGRESAGSVCAEMEEAVSGCGGFTGRGG
jgi:putative transposase